jgi:hypothetical protein
MTKACLFLVLPIVILLSGCQRPADYLYDHPETKHVNSTVKVKEFVSTNRLDILWVIDNSGSMTYHQKNVIANMDSFINSLSSTANTLDWKSGLISTTLTDAPYAGFAPGTELMSSDPQVASKFKHAVARLGTDGDGTERMFDPIVKAIKNYPNFLRADAAFALIIISDAPEQSSMKVDTFLQTMKKFLGGTLNSMYFYGFLNPVDWCVPTDDRWDWAGSPFEFMSKQLQGKVYQLCDPNFASNLTNLGQNLGHLATTSTYRLPSRPRVSSLKVYYNGKELPSGAKEKGGYWLFNVATNSIEFSDLSFAPGSNEAVDIVYDLDNGVAP